MSHSSSLHVSTGGQHRTTSQLRTFPWRSTSLVSAVARYELRSAREAHGPAHGLFHVEAIICHCYCTRGTTHDSIIASQHHQELDLSAMCGLSRLLLRTDTTTCTCPLACPPRCILLIARLLSYKTRYTAYMHLPTLSKS